MIGACAKVYDMPNYQPRVWDLDENGQKKPNKWLELTELPTLNKLTIRRFEAIAEDLGFVFKRREYHPIASSGFVNTISTLMIRSSYLREFFTSPIIYEIHKPKAGSKKINLKSWEA